MNSELDALLRAFEATQENPDDKQLKEIFEARLDEVHAAHPEVSREALRQSVRFKYPRWLRSQQSPPTLPPKA